MNKIYYNNNITLFETNRLLLNQDDVSPDNDIAASGTTDRPQQISTVAELPPLTPQIASTSVDKNLDSHVPATIHSSLDPVALTPFAQSANAIDIPVSDSSLQMSTSEQPHAETLSNNPPSTFYGQKRSHISPFDISPNERPRRKRLTATLLTGSPFLQELKEAAKKKKKASNCTKGKETARTNEEPLVRKRSQTVLFSPES